MAFHLKSLIYLSIMYLNSHAQLDSVFSRFPFPLFGRPPRSGLQHWWTRPSKALTLNQHMELLGALIPKLCSFSKEKVNSRQRIFSPLVTFWAFLAQVRTRLLLSGRL